MPSLSQGLLATSWSVSLMKSVLKQVDVLVGDPCDDLLELRSIVLDGPNRLSVSFLPSWSNDVLKLSIDRDVVVPRELSRGEGSTASELDIDEFAFEIVGIAMLEPRPDPQDWDEVGIVLDS